MENKKQEDPLANYVNRNAYEFYAKANDEINSDLARMKKCVEVTRKLRMTAAELEVETAAMYHAELFIKMEEFEAAVPKPKD